MEDGVAIVYARLRASEKLVWLLSPPLRPKQKSIVAGREMKLSRKPAHIASLVSQKSGQWHQIGRAILPVLPQAIGGGIASRKKRSSARRAEGVLAKGVLEKHAFSGQAVDIGCPYEGITRAAERVVALLIGAYPEYVWGCCFHG